jgi:hypothetical protein
MYEGLARVNANHWQSLLRMALIYWKQGKLEERDKMVQSALTIAERNSHDIGPLSEVLTVRAYIEAVEQNYSSAKQSLSMVPRSSLSTIVLSKYIECRLLISQTHLKHSPTAVS